MNLKDTLNQEYLIDRSNIVSDFLNKFGVNVKQENDLYLFKYNQISARWDEEITKECRGIILRFKNEWEVVSRPFNKFFNYGESHCGIVNKESFSSDEMKQYSAMEKADGTCIQLWFDDIQNKWRASTLGLITPANVQDQNFTFSDLFFKLFCSEPKYLDKEYTFIFELCATDNRIITKYKRDHLKLLGIRHTKTGEHISALSWARYALFPHDIVQIPKWYDLHYLNISNINQLNDWVENESLKYDVYGEWPEGFVLYKDAIPIAKFKNQKYINLHAVGGGDIGHSKNKIIDAIFLEHIDDIYNVLTNSLKEFCDNVKNQYSNLLIAQNKILDQINNMNFDSKKDFALWINSNVESRIRPYFFQNADNLIKNNKTNVSFDEWMKSHYLKFDWKK